MHRPASAASRCSTVRTCWSPTAREVHRRPSLTCWTKAGMGTGWGRSARRNTRPCPTGAGSMLTRADSPECSPGPCTVMLLPTVAC